MAWTGYYSFGSNGTPNGDFTNGGNLVSSNNVRCSATDAERHSFTNWSVPAGDVPDGYTVNKMEVSLEGRVASSGDEMQLAIYTIKGGVVQTAYKTITYTLTADRTYVIELSYSEMGSPTPANIRASDFGVDLKAFELAPGGGLGVFQGDHLKIRFDVEPPAATRRIFVVT